MGRKEFSPTIRGSIYSTKLIESFNKQLRKTFRQKKQFPNEGPLDSFLVIQFLLYNDKFSFRCHKGIGLSTDILDSMFS